MPDPIEFTVPNLGKFTAKHRTLGAQVRIEQTYRKICGGNDEDIPEGLRLIAIVKSQLDELLDVCPSGFDLNNAHVNDCYLIYAEMRAAEGRFREGMEKGGQAKSE